MTATPRIVFARANGKPPAGPLFIEQQLSCQIQYTATEEGLLTFLDDNPSEIMIIDLDDCDFSLVREVRASHPRLLILPVLAPGQPHLMKMALELDICHFLHSPLDPGETTIVLKRALQNWQDNQRPGKPEDVDYREYSFAGMIGRSRVMTDLFDLIARVADDDQTTVLIRGESGTGKEMVAKAIHGLSQRQKKNFVPVNCAAIPDDLLESELFGYTKGAFTGAVANKLGRIQYADKGTLFLDEIGDMKSVLQAKLLRVLQEKEFEPVGAYKAIPVNTRIVAATHCDLEQLVSGGQFREDLYYRLSVIPLVIPPLRQRREDIPLLIEAFLDKYATARGRDKFVLNGNAYAAVISYDWPGNVRELENLIQHMSVLYAGREVELTDLPDKIQATEIKNFPEEQVATYSQNSEEAAPSHDQQQALNWEGGEVDFNQLINDFEIRLIVQAMKLTEGNKKEAARILNLKRTTLLEKIKKKDIEGLWDK